MPKVIVMGSAGMTVTIPQHEPPPPGGYRTIDALELHAGGRAVNTAIMVERLGVATSFTGVLGDDFVGHQIREKLLSEGIDVTRLQLLPERSSPVRLVQTDANGDKRFLYHPGTNVDYHLPKGIERVPCSVVHMSAPELLLGIWPKKVVDLVRRFKVARRTVTLDTFATGHGRQDVVRNIHEHGHVLELIDVVFTTVEEAKLISGRAERESMVNYFHERGVKVVTVRLNSKGALVSSKGGLQEVSVANAEVADTEGVSEGFAAGYLVGHVRGLEPLECTRLGCTVSGLCARAKGALAGTANRAVLEKVIAGIELRRGRTPVKS